jgi:hypothetical protein
MAVLTSLLPGSPSNVLVGDPRQVLWVPQDVIPVRAGVAGAGIGGLGWSAQVRPGGGAGL